MRREIKSSGWPRTPQVVEAHFSYNFIFTGILFCLNIEILINCLKPVFHLANYIMGRKAKSKIRKRD